MATSGPFGQMNGRPTLHFSKPTPESSRAIPNCGKLTRKYETRDHATPLPWLCRGVTLAHALLVIVAFAAAMTLAQPQPVTALESAQFFGIAALWGTWSVVATLGIACWSARWWLPHVPLRPTLWGTMLWFLWVIVVSAVGASAYFLGWLTEPIWIARACGIAAFVGLGLWWALAGWREEFTQRLLAQEAQQAALLARTRPHFLFNSLNTIAGLLPDQPEQAEEAITALAKLLQLSLASPHPWPLSEEIAATRTYLTLAALRYGARLRLSWHLSGDTAQLTQIVVPRWVLLPLVENAVVHAVAHRREPTLLEITVTVTPKEVTVRVVNPLAPNSVKGEHHHGLGLLIVREQVRCWGGRIQIGKENGSFVVQWHLPLPQKSPSPHS